MKKGIALFIIFLIVIYASEPAQARKRTYWIYKNSGLIKQNTSNSSNKPEKFSYNKFFNSQELEKRIEISREGQE